MNRESQPIFWVGLIILGLAIVVLFSSLWSITYGFRAAAMMSMESTRPSIPPLARAGPVEVLLRQVPRIFGSALFIAIGLFMMRKSKS